LEKLAPEIVIHRLASQATSSDLLITPHWPEGAGQIATMVEAELIKRGTCQGFRYQT
jgi:radical SAM superfamily enzyme